MDDLNQLLTSNFVEHYKRLLSCGVYCQQPTRYSIPSNWKHTETKRKAFIDTWTLRRTVTLRVWLLNRQPYFIHSLCATSYFQPKANTFSVLPQKSLEVYIPLFCKSQLLIIYSDIIPVLIVISMH